MCRFTTRDGAEIYYKDWGIGPAIVFSHGWPLSSDAFEDQMFFLAQRGFRCIAHDRRGHGRSSQPWDGNDMDHHADDLAELLTQLDLTDVVLVGHCRRGRGRTLHRTLRDQARCQSRAGWGSATRSGEV